MSAAAGEKAFRKSKPILVLDFDGVLHAYTSGWQGAKVVIDGPVEGAVAFCHRAIDAFDVWVVSSRCNQEGGVRAIIDWLTDHGFPPQIHVSEDGSKPPAFITLDDRALTFAGQFPSVEELQAFVPWNKKDGSL